jgi:acetyltransferase-like isoleucine patch superfamily enzyme
MLLPPYPGLTRVCLAEDIAQYRWDIGDHTYGKPNVMEKGRAHLQIGRFCSMAAVTIVLGNHDVRNVSSYPFDSLRPWWPGMNDASCHVGRPVTIGSDVWMGENCVILPGATIGHGAVIGAGAVVSGTVADYAVVVGNPGRMAKFRFVPDTIARLLATSWWDLPDEQVNLLAPFLASPDIDAFVDRVAAIRTAPVGHPAPAIALQPAPADLPCAPTPGSTPDPLA